MHAWGHPADPSEHDGRARTHREVRGRPWSERFSPEERNEMTGDFRILVDERRHDAALAQVPDEPTRDAGMVAPQADDPGRRARPLQQRRQPRILRLARHRGDWQAFRGDAPGEELPVVEVTGD